MLLLWQRLSLCLNSSLLSLTRSLELSKIIETITVIVTVPEWVEVNLGWLWQVYPIEFWQSDLRMWSIEELL